MSDDSVKNVCQATEHTAPATTVLRFDGENRTYFRQFCDHHAREELAKHDDAEVVESEMDPGDILARELGALEDRDR